MAFTNETRNYGLPDWIGPDKPTWLVDMNNAFETIDNQMKANETAAMQAKQIGESAMDTAGNAVEATHTNAAAISALTASLAETDTRVDGLYPKQYTLSVLANITDFGGEGIYAYFLNSAIVLYTIDFWAKGVKKSSLVQKTEEMGLSDKISYVFPGKLPLFNNGVDWSDDTYIYTEMFSAASGKQVFLAVGKGSDGYYYGVSQADYANMEDGGYELCSRITFAQSGKTWPTT